MSRQRDKFTAHPEREKRRTVETTMLRDNACEARRVCQAAALVPIVALVLAAGFTSAAADPTVFIEPETVAILAGDSTRVEVRVDDSGDPISCFIVHIHFDPAVLEVREFEEGDLYASSLLPTFPGDSLIAPDTLELYNCVLGSGTFVLGPGELASFEIEALAVGTSPLEFAFVQVRDIDRIPYGDPGWRDGSVWVGDPAGVGTGEEEKAGAAPERVRLRVSPNPTRGWVRIEVLNGPGAMSHASVSSPILEVYDLAGRLRRSLRGRSAASDLHYWDGRDALGQPLPAGLYVVRVRGTSGPGTKVLMIR